MNCSNCSIEIIPTPSQRYALRKGKCIHIFCGRVCAGVFNNKNRKHTEETKRKISLSRQEYLSLNKATRENSRIPQFCKICGKKFYPVNSRGIATAKKTCGHHECVKACAVLGGKRGGITTSSLQWAKRSRSKNEKYFAQLVLNNFPYVLTNKRMFGEYDADVILVNEKIAVHWNGPFHYKLLINDDHLLKIQSRDLLRYKAIEQEGYFNYIIDDRNNRGFSVEKVEKEFQLLMSFINTRNTAFIN